MRRGASGQLITRPAWHTKAAHSSGGEVSSFASLTLEIPAQALAAIEGSSSVSAPFIRAGSHSHLAQSTRPRCARRATREVDVRSKWLSWGVAIVVAAAGCAADTTKENE